MLSCVPISSVSARLTSDLDTMSKVVLADLTLESRFLMTKKYTNSKSAKQLSINIGWSINCIEKKWKKKTTINNIIKSIRRKNNKPNPE